MYTISFAKSYEEDVKSSVNYIKNNLQNPTAAENLKIEIKAKYKNIKENPLAYPVVSDEYLALKGYRFALVKNYMIFFIVIEKQIEIIRFLYGPMDWMNILKNET